MGASKAGVHQKNPQKDHQAPEEGFRRPGSLIALGTVAGVPRCPTVFAWTWDLVRGGRNKPSAPAARHGEAKPPPEDVRHGEAKPPPDTLYAGVVLWRGPGVFFLLKERRRACLRA